MRVNVYEWVDGNPGLMSNHACDVEPKVVRTPCGLMSLIHLKLITVFSFEGGLECGTAKQISREIRVAQGPRCPAVCHPMHRYFESSSPSSAAVMRDLMPL